MRKIVLLGTMLVVLGAIFGTIYVVLQQSLRMNANDPQIQLAEDASAALDAGRSPAAFSTVAVNMNRSLAPFLVIYDKTGKAIAGNGMLDSTLAPAPIGILKAAAGHDYHAVTWQPTDKLRFTAVSVAAKQYYVLSGRSLKEVERREQQALQLTLMGGTLAAAATLFGGYVWMRRTP